MEAALAAYGKVEEYGVAQVSTAATYAMADLYRDLGKSLLDSERPRRLSAEELEQYDMLLEEQAFPFEEKAIGIHERNARRAARGSGTHGSRRATRSSPRCKPGRYARLEITGRSGRARHGGARSCRAVRLRRESRSTRGAMTRRGRSSRRHLRPIRRMPRR